MLKVCYLLDFSVFKVNGPTINELEFIKSLEKQKKVEVIYFTVNDNKKLISENNARNSYFFDTNERERFALLFYKSFLLFFNFISFYFRESPDLIITRLGPVPLLQYLIVLFLPKKLYVKTASRFWFVKPGKNLIDKCLQKFLERMNGFILRRCLGVDTVTEKFKQVFERKYKINSDKIILTENSVNSSIFFPKENKLIVENSFPVLGYVGNVPSERGAKQLIKLYECLRTRYPDIAIIIAGSDSSLDQIKEYVLQKKYKNIHFLGVIPYEEVPFVINSLDIGYSFTTQHDLKEVGNSSQKLRQYISCGKPVITMKGTNQFVLENELGSLVDQNNIDEIVRETEKWIQRMQTEGEGLSDRLHAYACEHLSTEKTFNQRLEFWNYLLEQ